MNRILGSNLHTGYFARPTEGKMSAKHTQVHYYNPEKNRCLCGYRPHDSMQWQWCSTGITPIYVECPGCIKRFEELYQKEQALQMAKNPLIQHKIPIKFPNQKISKVLRKMIYASKYRYTETEKYLTEIKDLILKENGLNA